MGKSEGEVKVCPFCGEPPQVDVTDGSGSNAAYYCANLGCPIHHNSMRLKKWNTRAEGLVAKSEVVPLVKALEEQAEKSSYICFDARQLLCMTQAQHLVVTRAEAMKFEKRVEELEAATKSSKAALSSSPDGRLAKLEAEFVPYSTDRRGYPHMALDGQGRGKLLLLTPRGGSDDIVQHGVSNLAGEG